MCRYCLGAVYTIGHNLGVVLYRGTDKLHPYKAGGDTQCRKDKEGVEHTHTMEDVLLGIALFLAIFRLAHTAITFSLSDDYCF